jgi:hypothetical protein
LTSANALKSTLILPRPVKPTFPFPTREASAFHWPPSAKKKPANVFASSGPTQPALDPSRHSAEVTREIAGHLELAKSLVSENRFSKSLDGPKFFKA